MNASPSVLPRVRRLLAPHRARVAVLFGTILVSAAVGVAAPLLTKLIFDRALFPAGSDPRIGLLAFLVGLMIALIVVGGALGILQTYLASLVGQLVMHDLREDLYRHLQRMSLRFFTGTKTGEIQSRIANDVGGLGDVLSKSAVNLFASAIFLVAAFGGMVYLSWELALVTVAILPIFVYFSHRVGKVRRHLSEQTQETLAEMTAITQETLSVSGALLARVFGRHREALERFRAESRRLAELKVRQQMVGRVFFGVAQVFFLLAPALLYLGAGLAMAGGSTRFTPGTLVAFTALLIRLFDPVRLILEATMEIQAARPLFERVFQYLDLPADIVDAPNARTLDKAHAHGNVRFEGVFFRYQAGDSGPAPGREWTLADVDLEIRSGQLAALVGPSGAGKTTTSYLLARLYDVDRGAVKVDGIDVREIRLASVSELIGMVTQETYLFHASIRENLLYARPEATDEELEAAARLAFIHERICELDRGYETVVGERGYRMSGGEKQRLAIARAILRDPRILILDEATSSLDTASERLVQGALQPLLANRTTIAIAHRLSTILSADVIFVLDRGRLVERGTHRELVTSGGLYARLYEQQFQSGLLEARCEDGVVLASGAVVAGGRPASASSP